MPFNINQYLKNPMGAGSSLVPSDAVKNKFKAEFTAVRSRMSCHWYRLDDTYVAHVKVPSSSVETIFYDVVFEFGDIATSTTDLCDMDVRVFSNSPSFIFTYAKVFKDEGILCGWLEHKYQNKALTLDPSTRNKYKIISYEKSLYLACLYMSTTRTVYQSALVNSESVRSYDQIATKVKSEKSLKNARNKANKKAKKANELKKSGKNVDSSPDKSVTRSSSDNTKPMRSATPKYTPKTKKTSKTAKNRNVTAKVKKTKKV